MFVVAFQLCSSPMCLKFIKLWIFFIWWYSHLCKSMITDIFWCASWHSFVFIFKLLLLCFVKAVLICYHSVIAFSGERWCHIQGHKVFLINFMLLLWTRLNLIPIFPQDIYLLSVFLCFFYLFQISSCCFSFVQIVNIGKHWRLKGEGRSKVGYSTQP